MGELVKQVLPSDLECISRLLDQLFSDHRYDHVERLGGMTNRTYQVIRPNQEEYLVRLPGQGTEELINRKDEYKSTKLACQLGIDAEMVYFGEDGIKVMEFIPGAKEVTEEIMQSKENIHKAASILRKLHDCGEDTGVRFEVFEMASAYEKIIQKYGVELYDDYQEVKEMIYRIKSENDQISIMEKVPCHNDTLVGNWLLDQNNRLYLIDWEYSGMNDPMWDLSCLSIECQYTEKNDVELLTEYFGRMPSKQEQRRLLGSKLFVDYLWTLWGLTRVPYDGNFMQEYADGRYKRLKQNIVTVQQLDGK